MMKRATEHHLIMAAIHPKPKPVKQKKEKRVPVEKQRRKKKLDPDYWFSLCVRERASWTCENCGKYYQPDINITTGLPGTRSLQCSHYIGRGNYAVRFDPMNADAHCTYCHRQFEGNPHNFKEWKYERLGVSLYDILIEKSNNFILGKQARHEKQEIAEHYRREFYRIQKEGGDLIGYL